MSNQWFRLYAEILNDPKVQILTEALRWRYVALLCLQCNGNYEKCQDDEIALSLRVTVDEWIFTRQEFIKRGLLDSDYKISGWEKRQYISDIKDPTASQRQKRYRDNKRNARNDSVTSRLPDSDTDTEREEKEKSKKKQGSRFTLTTLPDYWKEFCKQKRPDLNPEDIFLKFSNHWTSKTGRDATKLDWYKTWQNWVLNESQKNKSSLNNEPQSKKSNVITL